MGHDDPNLVHHANHNNAIAFMTTVPGLIIAFVSSVFATVLFGLFISLSIDRWLELSHQPVVCYASNIVDAYPHARSHDINFFIPGELENPQSFMKCVVHALRIIIGVIVFTFDEVIVTTHLILYCVPRFIIDTLF